MMVGFAAVHESAVGPEPPRQSSAFVSVIGRKAAVPLAGRRGS
jgi:hypothetical protein